MNDLLAQLHNIEGLDPIHWWPLAPGWWVLMGLTILALLGFLLLYFKQRSFKRSWQHTILSQLSALEQNLSESSTQETLIELSGLLRRIAVQKYSRVECAGLEGKTWLAWLTNHDPSQFDWDTKGACLIEAPYTPSTLVIPLEEVLEIIKAIKGWVKHKRRRV